MVQERSERLAREIIGEEIEPGELERISHRLDALKQALHRLEPLVIQEPWTVAALEDE